jgi:hypothetical protein
MSKPIIKTNMYASIAGAPTSKSTQPTKSKKNNDSDNIVSIIKSYINRIINDVPNFDRIDKNLKTGAAKRKFISQKLSNKSRK